MNPVRSAFSDDAGTASTKRLRRLAGVLACSALLASLTARAAPPDLNRGRTSDGWPYVEGGVGRDEIETLQLERQKYSLWVVTAARKSGAYLTDVTLSVTDARQRLVFERQLLSPWMLIDLPPGRYDAVASYNGEVLRRTTTIHRGDHHQLVFYFNVDADVLPDDASAAAVGVAPPLSASARAGNAAQGRRARTASFD